MYPTLFKGALSVQDDKIQHDERATQGNRDIKHVCVSSSYITELTASDYLFFVSLLHIYVEKIYFQV